MNSRPNFAFTSQSPGVLHPEKIFKNYNVKYVANPWYSGLANTFINSINYFDHSDHKLFLKHQKTRALGDFMPKAIKQDSNVFPRKKLDCGWIDYPNLEYRDKVTGIGLRRLQGFRSNCPLGQKRPFRLESLPERFQLEGKKIPTAMKVKIPKGKYIPSLSRWAGVRPDLTINSAIENTKTKSRPIAHKLDSWIKIPYTMNFFDCTRNFETAGFLIHELLKPHKAFLSEGGYADAKYAIIHAFRLIKRNCSCPSCQKATKARTIIDATTNWLGFTNKEIGAEKLVEIISVFTGNTQYQEYYAIEENTKAIVVKQIPMSQTIIIGINGEPVSHTLNDFTIISEIRSKHPFDQHPEYNKEGRQLVEVYPSCEDYIPLSWEEQIGMKGIKILYGHGRDIQYPNEKRQPTTVANLEEAYNSKKYLPANSETSERSILEVRDWFTFCKLTRSLIRSTPRFATLTDRETFNLYKMMIKTRVYDKVVDIQNKK